MLTPVMVVRMLTIMMAGDADGDHNTKLAANLECSLGARYYIGEALCLSHTVSRVSQQNSSEK